MAETSDYDCATEIRDAVQQLGRELFEGLRDLRHTVIEASDLRHRAALVAWAEVVREYTSSGLMMSETDNDAMPILAVRCWRLADQFVAASKAYTEHDDGGTLIV